MPRSGHHPGLTGADSPLPQDALPWKELSMRNRGLCRAAALLPPAGLLRLALMFPRVLEGFAARVSTNSTHGAVSVASQWLWPWDHPTAGSSCPVDGGRPGLIPAAAQFPPQGQRCLRPPSQGGSCISPGFIWQCHSPGWTWGSLCLERALPESPGRCPQHTGQSRAEAPSATLALPWLREVPTTRSAPSSGAGVGRAAAAWLPALTHTSTAQARPPSSQAFVDHRGSSPQPLLACVD